MAQTRIRQIGEGDTDQFAQTADYLHAQQPPPADPVHNVATSILFTSLRALSQRAVIALANLFVLLTAVSAFWLWYATMPAPSVLQLVGLSLYGVLILALNWLVLRRV